MTTPERLAEFFSRTPQIEGAAFVAPCATVQGAVTLGKDASVFYGAILRGDINTIEVGTGTNIQDGSIIHLADEFGTWIGDFTTVGHGAIVHACRVGHSCLIGMRATLLDGCEIGDESLVAAGSIVTPGAKFPPGVMLMGAPAKVKRELSPEERQGLKYWAEKYVLVAKAHAARLLKTSAR